MVAAERTRDAGDEPNQSPRKPFSVDLNEFRDTVPENPTPLTKTAAKTDAIPAATTIGTSINPPSPPKGAVLFCQSTKGRPCGPEAAYLWCWAGSPRWHYTSEYPVPSGHPVDQTRWE